jgi:hypothetical protein
VAVTEVGTENTVFTTAVFNPAPDPQDSRYLLYQSAVIFFTP